MRRLVGPAVAVVIGALAAGCAQPGATSVSSDPKPDLVPVSTILARAHGDGTTRQWRDIVSSTKKMYGIAIPGAPRSLTPLLDLAKQVDKTPSALEYFKDWGTPFDPADAQRTCVAGMIPELTWETWDWQNRVNGKPAAVQPTYAPRRIANGHFDSYIRQSAKAMKSVGCTMLVRLDQEANGYWYPWGIRTPGMHTTPASYVAMWRHVWGIFHRQHVHNVKWVWSPNLLLPGGKHYPMAKLYPGDHFVDAVGIDGYLGAPQQRPSSLYALTLAALEPFASNRPWFISETGVANGPHQAQRVRGLIRMVARSPLLHGLVYFDSPFGVQDWSLHGSALRAFRRGIADPVFGAALH